MHRLELHLGICVPHTLWQVPGLAPVTEAEGEPEDTARATPAACPAVRLQVGASAPCCSASAVLSRMHRGYSAKP